MGWWDPPKRRRGPPEKNSPAATRKTSPHVFRHYLRWFELERRKRTFDSSSRNGFLDRWRHRSLRSALHGLPPDALGVWARQEEISLEEKVAPESAGAEN